ncbi:GNAT family N-acetyltransferase [Chelativorans sp. Marseille-P2723]|uniref:GNAT family N-acetyltransferase n=1 Tax=Chelativorans sp. Marseille-P2723 TaxID=2709133 RepID=UPI00156E587A|nr:GNAT family N-acetyltransferase [Chelativorans sp. Marseille-P2723]
MLRLRQARRDEGDALTALCLRSKAAHGYDDTFIAACREELTVDPASPGLIVAELDGTAVGLAQISTGGEEAELDKLFVEPAFHGRGIGRALLESAAAKAAKSGAQALVLDSDPGAAAFYERMGAVVTGRSRSGSIPGRLLPRLRLEVDRPALNDRKAVANSP